MKAPVATVVALLAFAAEAGATASLSCVEPEGETSVELVIGNVPGLAVVGGRIDAAGQAWVLNREGGTPLAISQAFATADAIRVDFTDDNVSTLIAELRLFRADEGKDAAMAGTLRILGVGAWPLVCTGS